MRRAATCTLPTRRPAAPVRLGVRTRFRFEPRSSLEHAGWANYFSRLSAFSRLILFDERGTGLSDRVSGLPDLESRMDDVRAVMDAADCESAALFGISEGGAMSMLFAATYPERTRAAVRCASAIVERVRPLGLDVRGGLHTDEIEIQRDDIGGIAVHIAARVAGLAGTGEVLVFNTVRDLVAGSGLRFHDRGSHPLKGLPEPLRLFAAEA